MQQSCAGASRSRSLRWRSQPNATACRRVATRLRGAGLRLLFLAFELKPRAASGPAAPAAPAASGTGGGAAGDSGALAKGSAPMQQYQRSQVSGRRIGTRDLLRLRSDRTAHYSSPQLSSLSSWPCQVLCHQCAAFAPQGGQQSSERRRLGRLEGCCGRKGGQRGQQQRRNRSCEPRVQGCAFWRRHERGK